MALPQCMASSSRALLASTAFTVLLSLSCTIAADEPNLTNWYSVELQGEKNAAYQANVDLLFTRLYSKVSILKFCNSTVGDGEDRAYGLYLCPEDVSLGVCQVCLQDAYSKIAPRCPDVKPKPASCFSVGYSWYTECFLHYSDKNFFGGYGTGESFSVNVTGCSMESTTQAKDAATRRFVSKLVENASSTSSRFAAGSEGGVRGRAMCTRDLDGAACKKCLSEGLTTIWSPTGTCKQRDYVRYSSVRCSLMFWPDTIPVAPPAPASESAPAPASEPGLVPASEPTDFPASDGEPKHVVAAANTASLALSVLMVLLL